MVKKVTYTLDTEIVQKINELAAQRGMKKSQIVTEIVQKINELAAQRGMKKSQIVREAIEEYIEDYNIDALEALRIVEACDRGEMRVLTYEEVKARLEQRLKSASIV
jgi:predicted DNA-binding protein